jgi:ELWxxDGT repeat protein
MPNIVNSIEANGALFFTAFTQEHGLELWQTDGTPAGTKLFLDIEPGAGISYPFIFKPFYNGFGGLNRQLYQGNKFFFSAFNGSTGFELYVSDGTLPGTKMVKDIYPGYFDGLQNLSFFYTRDHLYFNAQTPDHGDELWRTDGTAGNTRLTADLNTFPGIGSKASPVVIVGNRLLITGDDGDSGPAALHDLYALNGIEQPLPIRMTSFTGTTLPAGNLLQWSVAQATGFSRFEVWRSYDGSNFQKIGTVAYQPALANYQYTDNALPLDAAAIYYKLKLVDASGSAQFTHVVMLGRTKRNHNSIKVAQAGSSNIQLIYNLHKPGERAKILDLQGRILQSIQLPQAVGSQMIHLSHITRGAVLLVVVRTADGEILSEKTLLQ